MSKNKDVRYDTSPIVKQHSNIPAAAFTSLTRITDAQAHIEVEAGGDVSAEYPEQREQRHGH